MPTNNKTNYSDNLPANFEVKRGQTQKNVNRTVLSTLLQIFQPESAITALDLPCGDMEFLSYVNKLFPKAKLFGADIEQKKAPDYITFKQMDLTKNFALPDVETFDLITSVSGVMVFGNTQGFINNCVSRLKPGGTLVITNDNCATVTDRLAYLFLARYRIFNTIFEQHDTLIQIVPIQELCYLLKMNNVSIQKIEYTSFYLKDLMYLPFALLVYPFQLFYLLRLKSSLSTIFKKSMYPFKHLFCKHYVIVGKKGN
jgi:SAM-dependent methyltransferase